MSEEAEPNDLDREVDASMRMFEKSKVGPAPEIAPIKPARILLILDGSPQDQTGIDAASHLRNEFNVETLVLDARQPKASSSSEDPPGESLPAEDQNADAEIEDLAIAAAESISGARPLKRKAEDAYDAILNTVNEHAVDLLILPCPFERSFEDVGADSAGTVIDVLLARSNCPMLIIRRDDQRLAECAHTISMVVGSECEMAKRAAGWVFAMASKAAAVSLNLVIEKEQYQNIKSIIEALAPDASFDPQAFSDALTKTHQSIHESMSKTAASRGLDYRLRPQAGETAPPNLMTESTKMLLVVPLEVDDRFGQGFVQDRIRRSPHPVLVIPGHALSE